MNTIQKYSTGTKSEKPSQESIALADFIINTCVEKSLHHDISVWDDGTLCVECARQEHDDIFINLFADGVLDISVYNYKTHDWDINLPNATKQDFVKIFEQI